MTKLIEKMNFKDGKDYSVVKGEYDGKDFYATIPCELIDENGRLTKELTGPEMCVSFESYEDAIRHRVGCIEAIEILKDNGIID